MTSTANVMITWGRTTVYKLCDFGLSVVAPAVQDIQRSLQTGSAGYKKVVGTPHYMSPEQSYEGRAVDTSTDLWSLAVVLFEALTGRRPSR